MDSQSTQATSQNNNGSLYLLKIKSNLYKTQEWKNAIVIFSCLLIIFTYHITFLEWPNILFKTYVLKLYNASESPGRLSKTLSAKSYFHSIWSEAQEFVVLTKCPGDAAAAAPRRTLWESLVWRVKAKLFQIHITVWAFTLTITYEKSFDFLMIRW